VRNEGAVTEELMVRAGNFQNLGSAGEVDYKQIEFPRAEGLATFFGNIFHILTVAGFLVLGLLILYLLPNIAKNVEEELTKSKIIKALVGFALLIATPILTILLAISSVGFPLAVVLGLLFIVTVLVAGLFVALYFGRLIGQTLNFETLDWIYFVIGFTALNILYMIPFVGFIIQVTVASLGIGAIFYTLRQNWSENR
jgi:hypothetical protein